MRFLADECVGRTVVERLRNEGFDVVWVSEECPGASDDDVLARAADAQRVLLTLDKDFGELTVRMRRPAAGIMILALPGLTTREMADRLARALRELQGREEPALTIIEEKRIRRRPIALPDQESP